MSTTDTRAGRFSPATVWVLALSVVVLLFDGYDLIVYGTVVPLLLQYQEWSLTPAMVGVIGSYTLVGMLLGALAVGTITDVFGRRKMVLFCVTWYSVFTGLCAIAPSPEIFGLFRFLAGLGLGGVIPTVSALTVEYAPPGRQYLAYAVVGCGIPSGGILAATVALPVIPAFGWQAMFAIGLVPLVLVVPLAYKFLPESISFLLAKGRREEAEALAGRLGVPHENVGLVPAEEETGAEAQARGSSVRAVATLFSRDYVAATILFWVATFLVLLQFFGLNTWLPEIMRQAGYPLGSALTFLLALNLGGIVGTLTIGTVADRFGPKPATLVIFFTGAASMGLLSIQWSMPVIYVLVAAAGFGVTGTINLLNPYVTGYYPVSSRATGIGWSLGIGRLGAISGPIMGGLILGSQLALGWNFYAFALAGLVGVLVVALVPRPPMASSEDGTDSAYPRQRRLTPR